MNKFYKKIAENVIERISLEKLKKKSVLITGANGLLGSHMASVLYLNNLKNNFQTQVTCTSLNAPPFWLKDIYSTPGFKFIQADLVKNRSEILRGEFDYIIHGATYGQPKKFLESPFETMTLNSTVTEDLLKLGAKKKVKFLFMSSSEIYGSPPKEVTPTREDYPGNVSPLDQRSPYTSSKRFGETLCKIYSDGGFVDAKIARVSSIYGPGANLRDDRVINAFIRRALQTGELRLMDRGDQMRRWLYITDGLCMLFHILLHGSKLVYNVCGSDLKSIKELAEFVSEQTSAKLVFPQENISDTHTSGAPNQIDIDNTLIVHEAALNNLVPLREGLTQSIAWTKDLFQENVL